MKNTVAKQVKVVTQNNLEFLANLSVNDGYRGRISDILNDDRSFLPLTDVQVYENHQLIEEIPFMCLNKTSIFLITEKSEQLVANQPKVAKPKQLVANQSKIAKINRMLSVN